MLHLYAFFQQSDVFSPSLRSSTTLDVPSYPLYGASSSSLPSVEGYLPMFAEGSAGAALMPPPTMMPSYGQPNCYNGIVPTSAPSLHSRQLDQTPVFPQSWQFSGNDCVDDARRYIERQGCSWGSVEGEIIFEVLFTLNNRDSSN